MGKKPAAAVEPELADVEATEPAKLPAEKPAPVLKNFRVHLKAASPLAHNPATVEGVQNGDEAWAKFCELNGISSSDHEREITEVTE